MEETIIAPVERDLLVAELTPERKLRTTNKGGNEIYVVTYHQAPNVLREIGRLREIAFRTAGGVLRFRRVGRLRASLLSINRMESCLFRDFRRLSFLAWC